VARPDTYKGNKLYFDRFMYDLISMFGLHLFYLEVPNLEILLRRVYRAITYNFEAGKVQLRSVKDVNPAFTEKEFDDAMD
jgi:hypothetical protein